MPQQKGVVVKPSNYAPKVLKLLKGWQAGRQWRDVGQGDSPTSIYELPELYEAFQKSTRLKEIAISFARPTHSFGLCSSEKENLDKLLLQAKCGGWQQHRKNSYKIL